MKNKVAVRRMGKNYQYRFEIHKKDGKRKWQEKSGFATESEALQAGIEAQMKYYERCECYRGDNK